MFGCALCSGARILCLRMLEKQKQKQKQKRTWKQQNPTPQSPITQRVALSVVVVVVVVVVGGLLVVTLVWWLRFGFGLVWWGGGVAEWEVFSCWLACWRLFFCGSRAKAC